MKTLSLIQKLHLGACLSMFSIIADGKENILPELDCLIEPFKIIEISSDLNGVIKEFNVEKGDVIKKNDILLKLESSVELATVELARERTKLEAQIKSKEFLVSYTQRKLDRAKKLYEKKAISLSDKNDLENEAIQASYDLIKARQSKKVAELELDRAQKLLDKLTIRAPTDGVVMDLYLSEGESVKDKNIMKVAQIDPLRVEVIVPAEYFSQMKPGMTANIIPEIDSHHSYKAKIQIIDKVIDSSSGTFDVRLELPNKDYAIPAGVRCKISFQPIKDSKKTTVINKKHEKLEVPIK